MVFIRHPMQPHISPPQVKLLTYSQAYKILPLDLPSLLTLAIIDKETKAVGEESEGIDDDATALLVSDRPQKKVQAQRCKSGAVLPSSGLFKPVHLHLSVL
jgi:hypothetical protein